MLKIKTTGQSMVGIGENWHKNNGDHLLESVAMSHTYFALSTEQSRNTASLFTYTITKIQGQPFSKLKVKN